MTDGAFPLVLLVEDEAVIRMVAATGLEDAGFEVIEAENADQALAILRSRSDVGILFTDVQMPGSVDGLDLAGIVHQHWPAIKLVVTSARSLRHPVPDDGRFVPKPYTIDEMTHTVSAVIKPTI